MYDRKEELFVKDVNAKDHSVRPAPDSLMVLAMRAIMRIHSVWTFPAVCIFINLYVFLIVYRERACLSLWSRGILLIFIIIIRRCSIRQIGHLIRSILSAYKYVKPRVCQIVIYFLLCRYRWH